MGAGAALALACADPTRLRKILVPLVVDPIYRLRNGRHLLPQLGLLFLVVLTGGRRLSLPIERERNLNHIIELVAWHIQENVKRESFPKQEKKI